MSLTTRSFKAVIIEGFQDDLKQGGFDKHYLDPEHDEDDEKWLLGFPTDKFVGSGCLYEYIDRVDGLRTTYVRQCVIYRDVLESWKSKKK
jgi:hypothetical protein